MPITISPREMTLEQLKDLQKMRKDTQQQIASLNKYGEEHPEKRNQVACTYIKMVQAVMKMITIEQELLEKLETEEMEAVKHTHKKPSAPLQNFPFTAVNNSGNLTQTSALASGTIERFEKKFLNNA